MVVLKTIAVVGGINIFWNVGRAFLGQWTTKVDLNELSKGNVCICDATSIIGKAFAEELLNRQFGVVLVGGTTTKLKEMQDSLITKTANPRVHCVALDLAHSHTENEAFWDNFSEKLRVLNVSMLINTSVPRNTDAILTEDLRKLEENLKQIYPQTMLTYYFIQDRLKTFEETGKKSVILQIISNNSEKIEPGLDSAVGKYQKFLGTAIGYETSPAIHTTIALQWQNTTKDQSAEIDPHLFAKTVLGQLRNGLVYGPWQNRVLCFSSDHLPKRAASLVEIAFNSFISINN